MPDLTWFHKARYGMFIHWGAYSVAGRGEWARNRERIPQEEYVGEYVNRFKAERYDPRAWARLARAAGMKYIVLTTRHHDGFCLWDSAVSDFNAARLGPKRDLLRPFVEAVRAEGLRVGFYYSVADWHHPDYPDPYARDWPTGWTDEAQRQRFVDYYIAQLRELLTGYGQVDLLWYDGCIPQPLDGRRANELARKLQPDILINERNGEPFELRCSEQSLNAKEGPWEACLTLNDNWGYHAGDTHWKTGQDVVRMLTTTARSGGNLLLNIGPRADGTVPEESVRALTDAGQWLARNGEFLPQSERVPFGWNNCSTLTMRGQTVYVHFFASPGETFCLAEIANRVRAARFVDGGQSIRFEQCGPRLFLHGLPCPLPGPIATTVAIDLEGPPRALRPQETSWLPG